MKVKDIGGTLRRVARAGLALLTGLAVLAAGTVSAQAVQENGMPGYWFNPANDGSGWWVAYHGSGLGPVREENGSFVYCIEAGEGITNQGTWENADDLNSKIAAFMVDQHKNDRSDMTQAAVAYAIHDHLDRGNSHFRQLVAVGLEGADIGAVGALANQYWNDAMLNMPANIQASYQYTQGKRKGTFNPGIKNSSGGWIAGVNYTITDRANVVSFDATGTNTISGTTTGQEEHLPWTARSSGQANFFVQIHVPRGQKLNSPGQDLFKVTDPSTR